MPGEAQEAHERSRWERFAVRALRSATPVLSYVALFIVAMRVTADVSTGQASLFTLYFSLFWLLMALQNAQNVVLRRVFERREVLLDRLQRETQDK